MSRYWQIAPGLTADARPDEDAWEDFHYESEWESRDDTGEAQCAAEAWWERQCHADGHDCDLLIRLASDPGRVWHVSIEADFTPTYYGTAKPVTL